MSVKIKGVDYKKFIKDDLGYPQYPECWFEDELMMIDGVEVEDLSTEGDDAVADTTIITLDGGAVYKTGNDIEPFTSVESAFKRWLKLQNCTTILVSIPSENVDEFKRYVKQLKGTCK
jgi:hypothetical protein